MVRLAMVTFDATDARSLATWWSERFGEASTEGDEDFLTVTAPDLPLTLGFQRIDQARSQRNTVHLDFDLEPQDPPRDEVVATFVAAGAATSSAMSRADQFGTCWRIRRETFSAWVIRIRVCPTTSPRSSPLLIRQSLKVRHPHSRTCIRSHTVGCVPAATQTGMSAVSNLPTGGGWTGGIA